MITKTLFSVILLVCSANALAGPIFSMVGSGGIAPLHPDGNDSNDRMVVSGSFGISATGGGFMDGRMTLVDGFVLPTVVGGTTTIQASDIEKLTFAHTQPAFNQGISPTFSFTATAADIVSASGTIVFDGSEYRFTPASSTGDLKIETSLFTSWSVPIYGYVSGNWIIDGDSVRVGNSGLALNPGSQTDGGWELTGTSTVPEPSAAILLLSGMTLLVRRKYRNRPD